MRGLLVVLALVLAATAGCVAKDTPPTGTDVVAPANAPEDAGAAPAMDASAAPEASPAAPRTLPLALDGNVGTGFIACAFPVERCEGMAAAPGSKELYVEDEAGRVLGGRVELTWTAASPATQSLSLGLMLMGGEGCDSLDLGTTKGPSPLAIDVAPVPRDLCQGELVHAWVAGEHWGTQGPTYYQVDVDQEFRLEGWLDLGPAASSGS